MFTSHLSTLILAIGARTLGIITFMPGINSPQIPASARAGLTFGICIVVTPAIIVREGVHLPDERFALVIFSELALGIILGYGVSVLMEAARFAGELVDLQIGLRVAELFDPIGATRSSLLGTFYYLIAVTLFLQLDGHHWVLAGLHRSFEIAPLGCLTYQNGLLPLILNLFQTMLDLALRLGAPVVGTLLLADIACGLIVRAVPQINILFVAMPAKIGIGFICLAIAVPVLLATLTRVLGDLQTYITQILQLVT